MLALAARNVAVLSGASDGLYGVAFRERHAVRLVGETGELAFDRDALRAAARAALIDTLSARQNRTDSGIVARIAGAAIGADNFLPNMATEDFLSCLSRVALERACANTSVLPRQRAKDTRAALVERFKEERFVYPAALFAPDADEVAVWLAKSEGAEGDGLADPQGDEPSPQEDFDEDEPAPDPLEGGEAYDVAAE